MGTRRHLTTALAALLALGLVGCTDDSPDGDDTSSTEDGSRTTVEMTEVKGTESLRPKNAVIGSWDTVVSGKRGSVVTEIAGSDGTPTQLYAVDPTTRKRHDLEVTAPLDWESAGNAKTAVIAGDIAQDDARTPFVRVSSDLTSWEDVPISYPDKGWSFSGVGMDGTVPIVIAQKPDGTQVAMRLEGDSPEINEIPAAKGQEISPIDLVEHRGDLVLLASEGKRGDESITRVLTSDDGGKSWERGPKLPGAKGDYGVAGVVSTGTTLVATGWAVRTPPLGTTGRTWTSKDATTWKRKDTVPISWRRADDGLPREDYSLSAPRLVEGKAAFDQTCSMCTWTTRFVHDGSEAEVKDNQLKIRRSNPSSGVLPGSLTSGVRRVEDSLVLFGPDDTRTLVKGDARRWVSGIEELGDTDLVPVQSYGFHGDPTDGWEMDYTVTPHVLDGSVQQRSWTPKALADWSDVYTASDDEGDTAVAAGTEDTSDDKTHAAARVLRGTTWTTAKGLGRADFETVTGLEHVGDEYLMAVRIADDAAFGTPREARIYSSDDGVSWSEDKGTWSRHGDTDTWVADTCRLGDGTPFAIGTTQADPNARSEATVWTRSKGSWALTLPDVDGEGASFDSCATTGDTTVVSGSIDGDDIEWTTTDGETFTPRTPLPRGVDRGTPTEVEGGLVADGSLDTSDHVGPVVWFSTDGTTWQWAPVEVDDASADVFVMTAGDDVYAVTSAYSGDRIWKIDEIATTKVTGGEG